MPYQHYITHHTNNLLNLTSCKLEGAWVLFQSVENNNTEIVSPKKIVLNRPHKD